MFKSVEVDNLLSEGIIFLGHIGVNNWGFSREKILKILDKFLILEIPILGGDIYDVVDGIIQLNYDYWYCHRLPDESNKEFSERSIQHTKKYIENYKVNNKDLLFSIVPQTKKKIIMIRSVEAHNLLSEGFIFLGHVGDNWGFSREKILKILDKFLILEIPILGGDVYGVVNGIIQSNYDYWYCHRLPDESDKEYAKRSIQHTKEYIENYNVIDEDILFSLLPIILM